MLRNSRYCWPFAISLTPAPSPGGRGEKRPRKEVFKYKIYNILLPLPLREGGRGVRSFFQGLYRVNAPLVVQLSIKELENSSVAGADTETPAAGDAPLHLYLVDLQPLTFPAQGNGSLGVLVARVAFDRVARFRAAGGQVASQDWSPRLR